MIWDNDQDILGRIGLLTNSSFLINLRNTINQKDVDLSDCLSWGQIKSKRWLLEHLPTDLGTVFICGGWYGTLAAMMFSEVPEKFDKIRSFDIDPSCATIAESINKTWTKDNWKFKASTLDIHDITYPLTYETQRYDGSIVELSDNPDTVINTSCEHIRNFDAWFDKIPANKLVILQSNNFEEIDDHVNCSSDLDEFRSRTPLDQTLYEGTLELQKYRRFMRIGFK